MKQVPLFLLRERGQETLTVPYCRALIPIGHDRSELVTSQKHYKGEPSAKPPKRYLSYELFHGLMESLGVIALHYRESQGFDRGEEDILQMGAWGSSNVSLRVV